MEVTLNRLKYQSILISRKFVSKFFDIKSPPLTLPIIALNWGWTTPARSEGRQGGGGKWFVFRIMFSEQQQQQAVCKTSVFCQPKANSAIQNSIPPSLSHLVFFLRAALHVKWMPLQTFDANYCEIIYVGRDTGWGNQLLIFFVLLNWKILWVKLRVTE